MAISLEQDWASNSFTTNDISDISGDWFTITGLSGSNLVLVCSAGGESGSGQEFNSISGAAIHRVSDDVELVTTTNVIGVYRDIGANDRATYFAIFDDADLATIEDVQVYCSLTLPNDTTGTRLNGRRAVFSGVDQTTPLAVSDTSSVSGGTTDSVTLTSVPAGSYVIAQMVHSTSSTAITWTAPLSDITGGDFNINVSGTMSIAEAASQSGSVTCEWSAGASSFFSPLIAVALNAATSGNSITSIDGTAVAAGEVASLNNNVSIASVAGAAIAAGEAPEIYYGIVISDVTSAAGSGFVEALSTFTATINNPDVDDLTLGGKALDFSLDSPNTSISGTAFKGGLEFGASADLIASEGAANSSAFPAVFLPPTGWSYVTMAVDYAGLASGSPLIDANVTGLQVGDQIAYEATSSGYDVTLDDQGNLTIDTVSHGFFDVDMYVLDANGSPLYEAGNTFTVTVFYGILGVQGTVTAAGETATTFQTDHQDVASVTGEVVAAGSVASIGRSLEGVAGAAIAAGETATVSQTDHQYIASIQGEAAAAGQVAALTTLITGVQGLGVAVGNTATVISANTVVGILGTAIAAGETATVTATANRFITGISGDAEAAGQSADIGGDRSVASVTGQAVATGEIASVATSNNQGVISVTGTAVAAGQIATLSQPTNVVTMAGEALSVGQVATIAAGQNRNITTVQGTAQAVGETVTVSNGSFVGSLEGTLSVSSSISGTGLTAPRRLTGTLS